MKSIFETQVGYCPSIGDSKYVTKLTTLQESFWCREAMRKNKYDTSCITPHSSFVGKRDEATFKYHTGLHMVDIDDLVGIDADELYERSAQSKKVLAYGSSFSNKGVHMFFRLDKKPTNPSEQKSAKNACLDLVRGMGLKPDTGFNGVLNDVRVSSYPNNYILFTTFEGAQAVNYDKVEHKFTFPITKDPVKSKYDPEQHWREMFNSFNKSEGKIIEERHQSLLCFLRMLRLDNTSHELSLKLTKMFCEEYLTRSVSDQEIAGSMRWTWKNVHPSGLSLKVGKKKTVFYPKSLTADLSFMEKYQ